MPDADVIDIVARALQASSRAVTVRIAAAGVEVHGLGKQPAHYPWEHVTRISFDDPGRTRASVGAMALFGPLGLAARKSYTLLTVSTTGGDAYFESSVEPVQWRTAARRIPHVVPAAAGRVFVDGQSVDAPPPAVPAGWYADPYREDALRWHDGAAWTGHTSAGS